MKKKFIENAQEVLGEFKNNSNAHPVEMYKRHGDLGPLFGTKFSLVGALQKRITPEIDKRKIIAEQLWDSKIMEPMMLASKLFDPKDFSIKRAIQYLNDSLDWKTVFYYFSNYVCPFIENIDNEIDNIYKENRNTIRILGYVILGVWATLYDDDKLPINKYISWTKQLALDIKNNKYDFFELRTLYSFLTAIFIYVKNSTLNELVKEIINDFPPNSIKKLAPKEARGCVVSDPFKSAERLIKSNSLYVKRKSNYGI